MSNITLKQLRAFITLAKVNSFAEACQILHLSQPALSISIKNLENDVGGKLFIRSTRSVTLTPEGRDFYPVAKRLLLNLDDAFYDLTNLFSLNRGKLAIAAMPSFASSELASIIKKFKSQYPEINIKIHDIVAENAVAMVRNGQAELALTFDPNESEDLIFQPLLSDQFILALPKNHPLTTEETIAWQEVVKYPFITLQRPSNIRYLIEESLKSLHLTLNIEFEANQLTTIGQLITEELGISAMPALCKKQLLAQGVICKPLHSPIIERKMGIVTRRRTPLSSAAKAFIALVTELYAHYS